MEKSWKFYKIFLRQRSRTSSLATPLLSEVLFPQFPPRSTPWSEHLYWDLEKFRAFEPPSTFNNSFKKGGLTKNEKRTNFCWFLVELEHGTSCVRIDHKIHSAMKMMQKFKSNFGFFYNPEFLTLWEKYKDHGQMHTKAYPTVYQIQTEILFLYSWRSSSKMFNISRLWKEKDTNKTG